MIADRFLHRSIYASGFEFDPLAWSQESYEVGKSIYDVIVGDGVHCSL